MATNAQNQEAFIEHGHTSRITCPCGRDYSRTEMRKLTLAREYRLKCDCGRVHYAELPNGHH